MRIKVYTCPNATCCWRHVPQNSSRCCYCGNNWMECIIEYDTNERINDWLISEEPVRLKDA